MASRTVGQVIVSDAAADERLLSIYSFSRHKSREADEEQPIDDGLGTMRGLAFALLFGGTVSVEVVFGWFV